MDPMVLVLALALLGAGSPRVDVSAAYVPASKGASASIAVTIEPQDPAVHVNESPGPRLKLDASQAVLLDKQAPARVTGADPAAEARYLDPMVPVFFPVAVQPGAPRGSHSVKGTVTYYFCSKTEGWCRKGTSEILVDVPVK
jgi:hypothetical protein